MSGEMKLVVDIPQAAMFLAKRRAQLLSPERRREIAAMGWKARRKRFSRAQLSEQMRRSALVRWRKKEAMTAAGDAGSRDARLPANEKPMSVKIAPSRQNRMCEKLRFTTRGDAENIATRWNEDRGTPNQIMGPEYCHLCRAWHVTSLPSTRKENGVHRDKVRLRSKRRSPGRKQKESLRGKYLE